MHWNDIYPTMPDEMVQAYEDKATPSEKARMEEWFGVERILNPTPSDHVVSVSLFWKNVNVDSPILPVPTEDLMRNAVSKGLVTRYPPWEHYVEPLLKGAVRLKHDMPDAVVRVYLAKDMEWMADRLVALHCEVHIMKSSSIWHSPGAMWRLLAMEDAPATVTFFDADYMENPMYVIGKAMECFDTSEDETWRSASCYSEDLDCGPYIIYRPMTAGMISTIRRLPIRRLMEAFIWHSLHGNFTGYTDFPGVGRVRHFGCRWPNYGFDEWFLAVVIYPRLAVFGMSPPAHLETNGHCRRLDTEYINQFRLTSSNIP